MTSAADNSTASGTAITDSPGQVLAAARESRGLSLEVIHEKTLIPVWKLKALEADQYTRLGGRPFAIGYLRQVAKLLEVDATPLVEHFNRICKPVVQPELPEEQESAAQVALQLAKKPLLSLWSPWTLLVSVIIWFASVWLFQNEADQVETLADDALLEPQPAEESLNPAELEALAEDLRRSSSVDPIPQLELETVSEIQPVDLSPTPTVDELPAAETPAEPLAPALSDQDQLAMAFTEQCWVEVRDVRDTLLVAKLYDKGDNLRLSGEGPFSVLLGNAAAAQRVTVNGREFEVVPRGAQKTLRLVLPPLSSD
ncbi:MAG: DUF4115 domain-containing protein [Cellvibrionaceae bacterium]|nr:DUF4115 domain-containing protein [Cellvibrionaceae bacterium]